MVVVVGLSVLRRATDGGKTHRNVEADTELCRTKPSLHRYPQVARRSRDAPPWDLIDGESTYGSASVLEASRGIPDFEHGHDTSTSCNPARPSCGKMLGDAGDLTSVLYHVIL